MRFIDADDDAVRDFGHDNSVIESVPVEPVMPATHCPGVHVKIIGKFAGNNVSLVVATGVPDPILILDALVATKSTWKVSLPSGLEAEDVLVSGKLCAVSSR